jgi:hypothetical protein
MHIARRTSKRLKRQAVVQAASAAKRIKREKTTPASSNGKSPSDSKLPAGYKTPPAVAILDGTMPIPKQNKKTGELLFADHPEFRPNMTPKEVLQAGSFGGTYFRSIKSSVTGIKYNPSNVYKEFPKDWFEGLNIKQQVTSAQYRKGVNRYNAKCGGDLEMWESKGWCTSVDPYGWFQWYCRFYLGRRTTDDERQISRSNGVAGKKGRFRNQLIGKCSRAGKAFDDISVSPVIRQVLQHWGYTLTKKDADAYVRKKKLAPLPEN